MSELADEHDLGLANPNVKVKQLVDNFLKSRSQCTSPHTIAYYKRCLTPLLVCYKLTPESITEFIADLKGSPGGKLAYYRAISSFCNWLVKNDYLNQSPLKKVDPPRPPKPILPRLTTKEVNYLIGFADNF